MRVKKETNLKQHLYHLEIYNHGHNIFNYSLGPNLPPVMKILSMLAKHP